MACQPTRRDIGNPTNAEFEIITASHLNRSLHYSHWKACMAISVLVRDRNGEIPLFSSQLRFLDNVWLVWPGWIAKKFSGSVTATFLAQCMARWPGWKVSRHAWAVILPSTKQSHLFRRQVLRDRPPQVLKRVSLCVLDVMNQAESLTDAVDNYINQKSGRCRGSHVRTKHL
ncbi:hypothetical protein BC938DRAFT_482166 [Jimgerdemannia flammicorona]|uniref:Uncharacterized protein n=1 Tax=Jimgerdemannia flammicorona TaxID=994334 RepID=A0A433R0Z5_9FUNG|nr:hypothetical protein BC938DRAFT_482166 [Jimgerdemannia flammicorona]